MQSAQLPQFSKPAVWRAGQQEELAISEASALGGGRNQELVSLVCGKPTRNPVSVLLELLRGPVSLLRSQEIRKPVTGSQTSSPTGHLVVRLPTTWGKAAL